MVARLLSRPYRLPARRFQVTAEDGVRLVGTRVAGPGAVLVLCHGFFGWHRKGRIVEFAERMARWFTVYAFDARGHGASGGRCTYGDLEYLDVEAVLRLARAEMEGPVATLGGSMGGIAVLRQAAFRNGADAVVAVSTPARWDGHGSRAVRRVRLITATRPGRRVARALGVRLTSTWDWPDDPEDVVGKIAPTPLIIVHGRDDHFFEEEEAWRLYHRAQEPKWLMLADRFGHAEDGFTDEFARRIARRLYSVMGLSWPARPRESHAAPAPDVLWA